MRTFMRTVSAPLTPRSRHVTGLPCLSDATTMASNLAFMSSRSVAKASTAMTCDHERRDTTMGSTIVSSMIVNNTRSWAARS